MLKGYIIVTMLLATDFCLYLLKGISLAGQLSDKILFWIWLIMTIIIAIKFFTRKKWLKWYIGIICTLITLSIIPFGMSFFELVEFATDTKFERDVENYKLRHDTRGLIDQISIIKVVRNIGIIEIELDEIDFENYSQTKNYSLFDVDKISLQRKGNDIFFEFEIDSSTFTEKLGNDRSNHIL